MAVSAHENISALGGKIFLHGETGNTSSNLGNVFGISESVEALIDRLTKLRWAKQNL